MRFPGGQPFARENVGILRNYRVATLAPVDRRPAHCLVSAIPMRTKHQVLRTWRAGLAALGAVLLCGCATTIHTDGQIPDAEKLASIQPGVQSEEQVKKLIGSPSSESIFGPKTYYYISKRTSQFAFLDPSVEEQKVIEISFDDGGKVDSIRQYGLNDAKEVSPVAQTTPTKGKHLTILDQMLGNLNKYGAAASGRAGPGGSAPGGPGGGSN